MSAAVPHPGYPSSSVADDPTTVNADSYGERSSVGLGRAMLALFISSVLTTAIHLAIVAIGAEPHSLSGGLLYFVAFAVARR